MTDINQTIKELWQKTYRNQDIDYIQVRSSAAGSIPGVAERNALIRRGRSVSAVAF